MNYKTLTIGDTRKEGDEFRQLWNAKDRFIPHRSDDPWNPGPWQPISLVGEKLIAPDFFNAEFRRPIHFKVTLVTVTEPL